MVGAGVRTEPGTARHTILLRDLHSSAEWRRVGCVLISIRLIPKRRSATVTECGGGRTWYSALRTRLSCARGGACDGVGGRRSRAGGNLNTETRGEPRLACVVDTGSAGYEAPSDGKKKGCRSDASTFGIELEEDGQK